MYRSWLSFLSAVRYVSFVVCCLTFDVCCPLLSGVCCSVVVLVEVLSCLFVFLGGCCLFAVCRSLFVVCCVFCVFGVLYLMFGGFM